MELEKQLLCQILELLADKNMCNECKIKNLTELISNFNTQYDRGIINIIDDICDIETDD